MDSAPSPSPRSSHFGAPSATSQLTSTRFSSTRRRKHDSFADVEEEIPEPEINPEALSFILARLRNLPAPQPKTTAFAEPAVEVEAPPTAEASSSPSGVDAEASAETAAEAPTTSSTIEPAKLTAADLFSIDDHGMDIAAFFSVDGPNRLLCFVRGGRLEMSTALPAKWTQMCYFVRPKGRVPRPGEDLRKVIMTGLINNSNVMWQMYRVMNDMFAPAIMENQEWPVAVKQDIVGSLHKFMASLTEHAYETLNKTVLYIPAEDIGTLEEAVKDKVKIQRFETIMINWTRQITEVVSGVDSENPENVDGGPLGEISFWHARSTDLSSIRTQLELPVVHGICEVLEVCKSSYLASFQELTHQVIEQAEAAEDNLQFLSSLQDPCTALAKAKIADIPRLLPDIINAVRMVSAISRYYNTQERVVGLLRKVSNAIIQRCVEQINLESLWSGEVLEAKRALMESIATGRAWNQIFHAVQIEVNKTDRPWHFGQEAKDFIFAYIETFVQRCRDMLDVCNAQLQFAPRDNMPTFGGTTGPDIQKSIVDIQTSFVRLMDRLRGLKYNIMDVSMATRWHDDFNVFNSGVKDLEMMISNAISSAFGSAGSLITRIELLQTFYLMARREFIIRGLERETVEICASLTHELTKCSPKPGVVPAGDAHLPHYAGPAVWAQSLMKRLDAPMASFQRLRQQFTLEAEKSGRRLSPHVEETVMDVVRLHEKSKQQIEIYVDKYHSEWSSTINENIRKGLDLNLIRRNETTGLLEANFDQHILSMLQEVFYWEKLHCQIPYDAMMVNASREKLRVLYENIMLVVRDYNRIMGALDRRIMWLSPHKSDGDPLRTAKERALFADRLRYLDRWVNPGLEKLTWVSEKNALETFVKETRKRCKEVWGIVERWQLAQSRIVEGCELIQSTLLVDIEKKRVYDHMEFLARQVAHMDACKERFAFTCERLQTTIAEVRCIFAEDSDEVIQEWRLFTQHWDRAILSAIMQTWKKSVQTLLRALTGDSKSSTSVGSSGEVLPIFQVMVVLAETNTEIRPSVQDLYNTIFQIRDELVCVAKVVPRLRENAPVVVSKEVKEARSQYQQLSRTASGRNQMDKAMVAAIADADAREASLAKAEAETFFDILASKNAADDKTSHTLQTLGKDIAQQILTFLTRWEGSYGHVWNKDKDRTVARLAKQQQPLQQLVVSMEEYYRSQEEALQEESTQNLSFLRFDCSSLKQTIVKHCDDWIDRYTLLLHTMAKDELTEIQNYIATVTAALSTYPSTLEELSVAVRLHKRVIGDKEHDIPAEKETIIAKFEPMRRKYEELEKQGVHVAHDEHAALSELGDQWAVFEQMLEDTKDVLARAKDSQRDRLVAMVDQFVSSLGEMRNQFETDAPTVSEGWELANGEGALDVARAMAFVKKGEAMVSSLREKAKSLKSGMDIFDIPEPPYKELVMTEKDLTMLTAIWQAIADWQNAYESWKETSFADINVASMEEEAVRMGKTITKLGREMRGWLVWGHINETVNAFKKTMPLIVDLRNQALRERHWAQLIEHIGESFDPTSTDFKLVSIVRLGLHLHSEFIAELSTNASKELAIEGGINKIAEAWRELPLDLGPYKATFRLKSTEEVFQALEDNVVSLSTMKGSKYFTVFEKPITHWEKTLGRISETVEKVQIVQKNWMYLENIFIGSEDIRKQLPAESSLFDEVHEKFQQCMRDMNEATVAVKACTQEKLDLLTDLESKLDYIQKKLENYLESKRQQFPRFYFLADDDLLAILGQAKDPHQVQKQLKKMFEGVKSLKILNPGESENKVHTSVQMFAPDGEVLPCNEPVRLEGRPEDWLNDIEASMFASTKSVLFKVLDTAKSFKKEVWVKQSQGQMVITAGQIIWTAECEKALSDPDLAKKSVRQLKKKWISYLNKLTAVTRSRLNKVDRNKVVSLITIEVHARDVIDKLYRVGASRVTDFEWVSQLRFYWDRVLNDCVVKQVLSIFTYGYEYQGNNGRLVITPLTDRCYMTLGAAMFTRRGGNPLGPAGTGKTETVKDFGKALARYVMVFNCSDGVTNTMTAKMFAGLAQTGAWACLDEFNRINVEVLSVVATQIATVMAAMKESKGSFFFEGQNIRLIPTCGIFVTMNPGYAGRSELPDNLKAIVRPVSMMVPDFTLIAEIMMFSEGFQTAKSLSKKMIAIMELSQQQLSKQDHYDYGLRSFVIPIARAAGMLKRNDPDAPEEVIMYRTMLDLIKPKLVYQDLPLFMSLLSDLFPGVELPNNDGGALRKAIEADLVAHNLQVVPDYITKIIQVFDCKVARHGNMIVGKTGAGKSTAWKSLRRAMANLKKEFPEEEVYQNVHVHTINPLALSNDEIYGVFNEQTSEWQPGVLARIMRDCCDDATPDQKWILFDGPVDTLWIESMNTTLDDNKLLTLLNGERIAMTPQVSILFEVEDLSQASPATVSRAGMIYLNVEDLGWRPFVTSWLKDPAVNRPEAIAGGMLRLFNKYIDNIVEARRVGMPQLVSIDTLSGVRTLCKLLDALATPEHGVNAHSTPDILQKNLEMVFQFCLMWSLGADLTEDGRKAFDRFMRESDPRFPAAETVFEYCLAPGKAGDASLDWVPWESKMTTAYRPPTDVPFFRLMVPTVDSVRTAYVCQTLAAGKHHVLVTGNVGVGKTMIVKDVLDNLPEDKKYMSINFSAQTSSNSLQDTIEGKMVKRAKGMLGPDGGKRMVAFIDDLNMPQKSTFGFIPPLELLKLWCDNGFWYDRAKCEVTNIMDMQLMAAMAPPGGGRSAFSQRVQACFSLVNVTSPSDSQLKRIFSTLLGAKLSDFEDEVKNLTDQITTSSIAVYRSVSAELLPTPSKSHYLFNTRDLAKIIQGTMQASKVSYTSADQILALWCHETFRVIGDRMWDHADKAWLQRQLDNQLQNVYTTSWENIFKSPELALAKPFVTFTSTAERPPYEQVVDMAAMKEQLMEKLEDYGMEPGNSAMDLVLFQDAMHHVCRIHRVLMQPRGNCLLVGVGGSGRKSMARLATYIAEMQCFTIEITKNYKHMDFREDLKTLYRKCGVENKPSVFLFDETQIKFETFLEDVNNILTSGEVPNLFPKDELSAVIGDMRPIAKKAGCQETEEAVYAFFLDRVTTNLHVILCLSPVGEAFRERCRMFPGLVNCTTIDWFTEWPDDALFEVAEKILEPVSTIKAEVRSQVAKMFVTAHQSVARVSKRMREEVSRINYVTPTNYLETVKGYIELLREKRDQLMSKAEKLRGGLEKLDETGVQVGEMQEVAKAKKLEVAQAKKSCEELLVQIVQDKRVADEREKQVNAEAAKIATEAAESDKIATECRAALDAALPALQAAEDALSVLEKKDISELKAYGKAPALVELTLNGVLVVLKRPPSWDSAKRAMGDPTFLNQLQQYDKDKIDDTLLKKIEKYTNNPDFDPEKVAKQSGAAAGMCKWVHAMQSYGVIAKEVAPKRAKLQAAQASLNKKQQALAKALKELEDVKAQVQALEDSYNGSMSENKRLEDELDLLEGKLQRAEKLVTGLAGERVRWEETIKGCEEAAGRLPGDVVVAAAFMSYAGPFPSEYREELVTNTWLPQVKALKLPASSKFDFSMFLANPADVRDWNIQGLPADAFSTENGVLVTRGKRWPLMVDPQAQANKWVKNMEQDNQLVLVDLNMGDMIRRVENAIQFGQPVLLQDVGEELDPTLDPVLSKQFIKRGNQILVKLGDKEVDYNPEFRLYITTKLPNPHYLPEISTKVTIVNFSVKEQGLQAQLQNLVVKEERPDLDELKNELVVKVARGKRTQEELEDQILNMLSNATGSLLDNVELIQTLDSSKTIWEEVSTMLKTAEKTSVEIEQASLEYAPVALRASVLYFVLNELTKIDPMYQFSLDAYVDLFILSIRNAPPAAELQERIKQLNEHHTYAVYKYTTRGLFERHKLLLSLQMCVQILRSANVAFSNEEFQFFLKGGTVLDRSSQIKNPVSSWMSEIAWDNVTEAEHLPAFADIVGSFDSMGLEWENWYRSAEPESSELPGEWETKLNELQRMVIVRCMRPDRVIFAVTNYVANALGRKYVDPPVLDLGETYRDSSPLTPLVFVLSPGVDPTDNLEKLAKEVKMSDKFFSVALGQGQEKKATVLIDEGLRDGHWVFLANCHLMTSWLPTLGKMIDGFAGRNAHPNFRLWLSSNPTEMFPIAILQRSIKMTTEPPRGLRANLLRLYGTITNESFTECKAQHKYQKLLFNLAFFHSVLLERRKFRTLGLNIPYDFNDTDFKVSDDILKSYLDSYEDTPWDALKYLISEANYGGRVTDELDRRVLNSYLNHYYQDAAIEVAHYPLASLPQYHVPDQGSLQTFKDFILNLPSNDRPEAFGQHPNADISYQTEESMTVLDSLVGLQPKTGGGGAGGVTKDELVYKIAQDLLDQVPGPMDLHHIMQEKSDDPSPLHVVLFQEVERYNMLLVRIRKDCQALQLGIKGLVVMSSDLDAIFEAFGNGKVPTSWLKSYPSLKGLGSWTRDLLQRIEQLATWGEDTYPNVYWLSGFTYPTGFLTAVLQTTARKNGIPIDTLTFEYTVMSGLSETDISQPPKEGVYVRGIYLEGGGWDPEKGCLCEPEPMKLVAPMPIIHFKPAEAKRKLPRGIYQCPLYMYPVRTGTRERPSYMISVDLKSGPNDPEHYIKRGTALLLSLAV